MPSWFPGIPWYCDSRNLRCRFTCIGLNIGHKVRYSSGKSDSCDPFKPPGAKRFFSLVGVLVISDRPQVMGDHGLAVAGHGFDRSRFVVPLRLFGFFLFWLSFWHKRPRVLSEITATSKPCQQEIGVRCPRGRTIGRFF